MDESVKRRERLKAMRMEAAESEAHNSVETPALSSGLSNPFTKTPASSQEQDSFSTPRFDFYTDPMAAFSSDKRRSKAGGSHTSQGYFRPPTNVGPPMANISSSPYGPWNPEMTPRPPGQFQTNSSHDHRMYQTPAPYQSPRPTYQSSRPPYQGSQPPYQSPQPPYQSPQPPYFGPGPHGSPTEMPIPFPPHQQNPSSWNASGGTPSNGFPCNLSSTDNFPISGIGSVGSPSTSSVQVRGQWFSRGPSPSLGQRSSPSPSSGRGRGRWYGNNMSPASGQGGGRGRGSHDHVSAQDRPERFYSKSMVDDPWKFLEPIMWREQNVSAKSLNTPESLKSRYMKRPKVSEASNKSNSQFSLAEYLAASFDETVKESPND